MDDSTQNILICGIGGQGVVLAGRIISHATFESGMDIKTSEVHGMSQRGGSVSTHIRFGKKIFSPLIPENGATAILSFDIYETLRYAGSFANKNTIIVSSNDGKTPAWTSKTKNGTIKNNFTNIHSIVSVLKDNFKFLTLLDDKLIAENLGNVKVSNIILIGALSVFTDIKEEIWLKTIETNVPEKTINLNIKAFMKGRASL